MALSEFQGFGAVMLTSPVTGAQHVSKLRGQCGKGTIHGAEGCRVHLPA